MLERRYLVAVAVIFAAFVVGLVGFFMFSAPFGDGLEKTMEHAGVEESEPVYSAPLGYGEDYTTALAMGVLGFFVVLGASLIVGRAMRKRSG